MRVACPARGTLLASKRLDAYLSILTWCLELAGIPVAPQLVDFLATVARRRADPGELPGLEAMMPDSPVVAWLNAASEPIPGDLRVVAGDMDGDSIGSWVKTLLADAFYWTDNDLVVQTRSMYGGAPRAQQRQRELPARPRRQGLALQLLQQRPHGRMRSRARSCDDAPADFAAIGPLVVGRRGLRAARAARAAARRRRTRASRPAVFVIPGILGSNLELDGKRIWLGFRLVNGLGQLAWDPKTASPASSPTGRSAASTAISSSARRHARGDSLRLRLAPADRGRSAPPRRRGRRGARARAAQPAAGAHRRPLDGRPGRPHDGAREARHLAAHAGARRRALAHARHAERRLVVADADALRRRHLRQRAGRLRLAVRQLTARAKTMAGMPGFLQLQAALLDPALGLDRAESWQRLADDDLARLPRRSSWHLEGVQRTIYQWGAPPQAVLDRPVALRKRLDAQAAALGADAAKMLLVVGHAAFTPAGYTFSDAGLSTSTRPAAATVACRSRARCCPAFAPGSSTRRTAICRARRAPSPPTSSCSPTARPRLLDVLDRDAGT